MIYIVSIVIGFITAFVGSIVGLGGGIILVPSLLLLHQFLDNFGWVTPQNVVGISLVVMIFTALSSTISYLKKGRVDYKSGFILLAGGIPGGILGSWLNQFVASNAFSLYFGLVVLFIFLMFFIKKKVAPKESATSGSVKRKVHVNGNMHQYSFSFLGAFALAIVIGMLSGLFGIGGGSMLVPAMILLFSFPPHIAVATSMFVIFFMSIISSTTHIVLGHVPWQYVWLFIPGAWVGGTLGAKVNQRLKSKTVEWVLRILLLVIGIRLIWQGL